MLDESRQNPFRILLNELCLQWKENKKSSYQRKENFGTDETFYQIVKALACPQEKTKKFSVNILGPTALGFRHKDDVRELKTILDDLNISILNQALISQ